MTRARRAACEPLGGPHGACDAMSAPRTVSASTGRAPRQRRKAFLIRDLCSAVLLCMHAGESCTRLRHSQNTAEQRGPSAESIEAGGLPCN